MSKFREGTAKIGNFFKRHFFIILIAVCGAAVITIIGLAIGGVFSPDTPSIVDPGDPVGPGDPIDPTDPVGPVDPTDPTDPVGPVDPVDPVVTYIMPVAGEFGTEYTALATVWYTEIGEIKSHLGLDIHAAAGTAVVATYDGTVSEVVKEPYYDGYTVKINHGNGMISVYKSLSSDIPEGITAGKKVKQGDTIGYVGNTYVPELAEDNHLHFEMILDGTSVNPVEYLILSDK